MAKHTVIPTTDVTAEYIYNLPFDIIDITVVWNDFYRKFQSSLGPDTDGTEDRCWLVQDEVMTDTDVAEFIKRLTNKSLILNYGNKQEIVKCL